MKVFLQISKNFYFSSAKVDVNQTLEGGNLPQFHSETGLRHNGRVAMIAGGSLERDADLARLATLSGCTPLS